MVYGLMDFESARLMGSYRTQREALQVVLDTIDRYGAESREALTLSLARSDRPGREGFIADGRDLVERALALRARRTTPRRRKRAAA